MMYYGDPMGSLVVSCFPLLRSNWLSCNGWMDLSYCTGQNRVLSHMMQYVHWTGTDIMASSPKGTQFQEQARKKEILTYCYS